jgi:hypothetical protein
MQSAEGLHVLCPVVSWLRLVQVWQSHSKITLLKPAFFFSLVHNDAQVPSVDMEDIAVE